MSGTTVSGAAASPGASQPGTEKAAPDPVGRRSRLTPVNVIIAFATLLALGLRLYQLARPGYLLSVTEYDDGPYFGSAIRLVDGSIPYRDFLLVQPPGITVLMIPAALVGKLAGTDWAFAIGRLLTVCAGAACVSVTGLLVRHRGVFAVVVACGLAAVYPDSIQAADTVLVEPWLALFCLLGAVAVFDRDRLTASSRRLAWGGVAFGFAGAVEVWAIFPLVVIAVLAARAPRRLAVYIAGAAAGFLVPVLPFAIIAPRGIYQGLVTAQVGGRFHATRVPNWYRVKEMVGLTDFRIPHSTAWLVALIIVSFVAVMLVLATAVTRRPPTSLEWFAVASTALVAAAFMWPNQFHYHFVAFLAPFLAMAIALPAARLMHDAWPGAGCRCRGAGCRCRSAGCRCRGAGCLPGAWDCHDAGERHGPGHRRGAGWRRRPGQRRGSGCTAARRPAVDCHSRPAVVRCVPGRICDRVPGHRAGPLGDEPAAARELFDGDRGAAADPAPRLCRDRSGLHDDRRRQIRL